MAKNASVPYKQFVESGNQLVVEDKHNAVDIYCPQPYCCSLIMRAKAGQLVERPKSKLNIASNDTSVTDDTNAEVEAMQQYWHLSMMAFETIAFSIPVVTGLQYLYCTECGTGPLGYQDSAGEAECFIAVDRVGYATGT
ncbi:74_t:CDS:2 [Paraglomus brasilianum]|uniref:74_t:CDS:1 n=1 Tax=Paraglomus brasilianum TaxID=144538 RepID=A0A9N9H2D0_9GLOM|nr:74_t:CDS:2 [Paraglomus brasilianum]